MPSCLVPAPAATAVTIAHLLTLKNAFRAHPRYSWDDRHSIVVAGLGIMVPGDEEDSTSVHFGYRCRAGTALRRCGLVH